MGITVEPLINFRNLLRKKGEYPIHLRVTIDREQRYYPVKVPKKVLLEQWSGKNDHWVDSSHPYAFEINNRILEMKSKVTELIKRFYNQNKPVSFNVLEQELIRKGDRTILNDYIRNYIDQPPPTVKLDPITWEKYEAFFKHLNNFQPRILFSEVDEMLIARFKNYLANLKGRNGKLNPATIKSYFDKFKVLLTHAARKDRMLDKNDVELFFDEVKIVLPKRKEGLHLEIEDIQKLRKLQFDKKDFSLERDRDFFLFQIYTGFYYNDVQVLKKNQLYKDVEHGYYIIGNRDKNDNTTIIPLFKFNYGDVIIEKYRDHNPSFEFLFDSKYFIEVQVYNRNLKLLAKRAEITRPISNKTGRHTNAQMWIRFGADRPVLSKMLGHEKEQTTQTYYKVNLREVIEGTKNVDFEKYKI
ncbi:MAG: site-specific integrase [Ferruginibacter sp.]